MMIQPLCYQKGFNFKPPMIIAIIGYYMGYDVV